MSARDVQAKTAEVRLEAAAWIARMRGPDADRSRLDFERWRAASPLHRQVYAEMQTISAASQQLGGSMLGREHRARQARSGTFAPRPRAWVLACAALLICVGLAAVILANPAHDNPQAIASAVGRIERVRLPDGTIVTLDTDSVLLPVFDDSTRLVRLLRGRGRFDVAHDARPFMVEAGDRLILDRGTVFDVAFGREGVKVALLRGAVEVRERTAPSGAAARLTPGQVFAERRNAGPPAVVAASPGAERWVDGMLSYDGAPLAEVVADIDRYSVRKLQLADPALGSLRVTGVFRAVPVEDSAKVLAATLQLHVTTSASGDPLLAR
jgi:transmembrane sensor